MVRGRRRRRRDGARSRCRPCRRWRACFRTARAWGCARPRSSDAAASRPTGSCSRCPADPAHDAAVPRERARASAPIDGLVLPRRRVVRQHARAAAGPRCGGRRRGSSRSSPSPSPSARSSSGLPGPRGFGAAPPATAVLQASDDGVAYRDVVDCSIRRGAGAHRRASRRSPRGGSGSCCRGRARRTRSRRWRTACGSRPCCARSDAFLVSEFALRSGGARASRRGEGRLRGRARLLRRRRPTRGRTPAPIAPERGRRPHRPRARRRAALGRPRGRLARPAARRLAHRTDERARAGGLDGPRGRQARRRARRRLPRHAPPPVRRRDRCRVRRSALRRTAQRQHRGRPAELDRRASSSSSHALRGYDPAPWLPALAGYVVGERRGSDRFLYDYRRTIAELLADGVLRHARGARRIGAAWPTTPRRSRTADRSSATTSRCARTPTCRWARCGRSIAERGPQPTYVADLKGASSVAHVHGKAWTGGEAFTSFDRPWASSPRTLKHVADLQLALGVTRFCIHTSPHQPVAAPPPGHRPRAVPRPGVHRSTRRGPGMARPWIDYLARCSALLSAGEPAVDVAVFVGEEAPVTGLFDDALDTAVPAGFDFDYVGADALAESCTSRTGACGRSARDYRLLYLGGSSRRMTLAALRRIERLLDAGRDGRRRAPGVLAVARRRRRRASTPLCDRIWARPRDRRARDPTATSHAALARARHATRTSRSTARPIRRIARMIDGRRADVPREPVAPSRCELRVTPCRSARARCRVGSRRAPTTRRLRAGSGSDGRIASPSPSPAFGSRVRARRRAIGRGTRASCAPSRWKGRGAATCPAPAGSRCPHGPGCGPTSTTRRAPSRARRRTRIEFVLPDALSEGERDRSWTSGSVGDIARVIVNGVDCGVGVDAAVPARRDDRPARGGQSHRGRGRDAVAQPPHRRGGARRPARSSRR